MNAYAGVAPLAWAGAIVCVLAAVPHTLFDLERHTLPKTLVLLLTGFGAATLVLIRARRLVLSLADVLLAAFLAVSAVSALLAPNPWLAFDALAVSAAGALLFWAARAAAAAGRARPILTALGAATAIGAATALLQAYGVESGLMAERRAPGGTFGNRNFMAHFVTLGLPLLGLGALEARGRAGVWLAGAGAALSSAALVLSRSRAAWLATGVALTIFVVEGLWLGGLWRHSGTRRHLLGLGGAAIAGITLALLVPNTLEWRSRSPYLDSLRGIADYREGSGRGRLVQYANTLRMALDHPLLGVGPGNWPVEYPAYTSPGDPAFDADDFIPTNPWPSSDWIALLAERGPLALALILAAGAALALGAWRRWRTAPERTDRLEGLAALVMLAALAVVASFDAVLLLPAPVLLAAAGLGALTRPARRPVLAFAVSDERRRALVGATTLLGLAFALRVAGQIAGMAALRAGDPPARQELAAHFDPGSYRIHMLLAYSWRRAGRCERARAHAMAARALFPRHAGPKQVAKACR